MKRNCERQLFVNQSIGGLFLDLIKVARERVDLHVYKGIAYKNSTWYLRLFTWFFYSLSLAVYLVLFGHKFSRILIVSNPPFAPLLAPLGRRPYALLLYDLYPQVLAQLQPRYALQRFAIAQVVRCWHAVNRWVFRRAERLITLSAAMADELKPYFTSESLWRERVVVIPPWADTKNLRPSQGEAEVFRQLHHISGLVVSYSGNMGFTHPLEILVEAAALLDGLPNSPPVQLLLIGNGAKRSALQQQADVLNLPPNRLRFLNRLPYSQLAASLSAADLAVVALDGPASAASLPSKTFNALACGTPLLALAPVNSALSQLVCRHRCGVVIQPGSDAPTQLVDAILHLKLNPKELQKLSENALAASYHYTPANAELLLDAWLGPLSVST